jgi:transcription factor C subunit 7
VQLPATVHKRIVLITHAATAITLIRGLLADRGLYPRIACCSLTTFARKLAGEDATQRPMGEWMTQGEIGDTSFLSKGRERDWGFEDVEVEHGRVIDDHGIPGTENDVDDNFGLQVPVPVARF